MAETISVNDSSSYYAASYNSFQQSGIIYAQFYSMIVSPCGLVLNIIVLITFIRVKRLVPPTTRLLMINQSFIEAMSSAVGFILQLSPHVSPMKFSHDLVGSAFCLLYQAAFWSVDTVLQLNNMAIILDRYFAVCFVFKKLFTKARVIATICTIWIIGLALNCLIDYMVAEVTTDGSCMYKDHLSRSIVVPFGCMYILFDSGPAVFVLIFYPQMVRAIRKAPKAISYDSESRVKAAASTRLLKTCFIATLLLIITNTPDLMLYGVLYSIVGIPDIYGPLQMAIDLAFKLSYPLFSPIIYSFSTSKFRAAIPTAFGCKS